MSVLHTKKCISLTTLLNVLFLLGVFWIISLVHTRRNCNKWRKSLFLPYCITKHYNLCHQYTTSSLWKNATHTNTIHYTTTTRNTIFQYFKSSVVACQLVWINTITKNTLHMLLRYRHELHTVDEFHYTNCQRQISSWQYTF